MGRSRTAILRIVAALLAVLVAGTLALMAHPILFTGRSYEFTVRSVEVGPDGKLTLTYDDVITYDTTVTWTISGGLGLTDSWDHGRNGFLRWPRKDQRTLSFFLTTDEELEKRMGDAPVIRERLLLKEGTYRIRAGERLEYYRRTNPDGTVVSWHIKVEPQR